MVDLATIPLPEHLTRLIWRPIPKRGSFGIKRSVALAHNYSLGQAAMRAHAQSLATLDPVLQGYEKSVRSTFYWEHGLASTLFPAEQLYKKVRRHRHRGEYFLRQLVIDEYTAFRSRWLRERNGSKQTQAA